MKKKKKYLYEEIEEKLLNRIKDMDTDSIFPTRSALIEEFSVTRTTIDKAIAQLISKGYLSSTKGKGTFVVEKNDKEESSNYLGVIVPNMNYNGYPQIVKGIEEEARKQGLYITISTTENSQLSFGQHVENFIKAKLRGIVIVPTIMNSYKSDWLNALTNSGIPFVLCNSIPVDMQVPSVLLNNFCGANMLTKYLLSRGCEKIAFISYPVCSITRERIQGYVNGLAEAGISYNSDLIYLVNDKGEETDKLKGLDYLLQKNPNLDAIICSDDKMAYTAYTYLMKQGYDIPSEISLAGFDNSFICNNPYCNLTSVDFKFFDMGVYACKLLMNKEFSGNDNMKILKDIYMVTPKVIVRDSTK